MTSPERLPPIVFTPAKSQRRERLFAGIICLPCGVGLLVFAGRASNGTAALVIVGVCLMVVGVVFLAARRAQTTIDAEGLRTASMFGQRSCRWSEVSDIGVDVSRAIESSDGNPRVSTITIHRHSGHSFTLRTPNDSSSKHGHSNPDFANQLATIRSYWQARTKPPQSLQP